MEVIESENEYGRGVVRNFASILEDNTLEQAKMTSRSIALFGPLVLMPDAHLGRGATVGSVLKTYNAIIPAAVGVDIGCGMIAVRTDLRAAELDEARRRRIAGRLRDAIPPNDHPDGPNALDWDEFLRNNPLTYGVQRLALDATAQRQFGTLGGGNHFVEVSEDLNGWVWIVLHSGSRGVGNKLAEYHCQQAKDYTATYEAPVEDPDLSFLETGTDQFNDYIEDMLWAQAYAHNQRRAMMARAVEAVRLEAGALHVLQTITCHHNYSEPQSRRSGGPTDTWLTRKGAIDASEGVLGIIPGSMGADTFIVHGMGNRDSYNSAPHGAGRQRSRGKARRELDVEIFKSQMEGKVWQDRDAVALLDEAPQAYKDIDLVMQDSADLVEVVTVLRSFINYKKVGR